MATRSKSIGLQLACWRLGQAVGLAVVVMSSGCALCDGPYDYDFAAFGGVRDRFDRRHGRVGSILDPADAAGGTKTVAVERSFVPAMGFRAPGADYSASEYVPATDAELPDPSEGNDGAPAAPRTPADDSLGPPTEPAPDLPAPAEPGADLKSGSSRRSDVPAELTAPPSPPQEDDAQRPDDLDMDQLFQSDSP